MKLLLKFKKDKPPFYMRWEATHHGTGNLSPAVQSKAMELAGNTIQQLGDQLQELGYDPTTMKFSINEKP